MTAPVDVTRADRDILKGHPFLQERWPRLQQFLLSSYRMGTRVIEVYRPEARQQWLYGASRTEAEMIAKGLPVTLARPTEPKVTNAWSAATSAHGYAINGKPASAALDIVPLGKDGLPYTVDDEWDAFVAAIAKHGPGMGLVHFHSPGKAVWDRPHLQLVEWSDKLKTVIKPLRPAA